ncbi:MAG: GNAT family N-acetyltransferase [Acidobacteria bacterium]|nr:GNAT family N-acetyltransferase [Acidobacteriota bacterium]
MAPSVILSAPPPLALAIEENLHAHVAYVHRRLPQMTVQDRDGLLLVDSGLPADTFNRICRARMAAAGADHRIEEALGYFRVVQRPFAWWVGPASRPLDLERRLQERGLRPAEYEIGMAMDLLDLPPHIDTPAGLEVRRVRTTAELNDFANGDPAALAFYQSAAPVLLEEDCSMRLFIGCLDGHRVATSELFLGGGVAGLYGISTRKEHQRRGIGLYMTWAAAAEARRLGFPTAVLLASEEGQRVYERLGFRAVCLFVEYQ